MRLTVDEYCKHFKMSKEMVNSKIKTKALNFIIEDGVTYIIVTRSSQKREKILQAEKEENTKKVRTNTPLKQKTTVATVLSLYQRENKQLKEKILLLEAKIDKLIDDKEQMLRDERDKIESLYTAKDEQLKNILELINTKMMLEQQHTQTIHEIQAINEPLEEPKDKEEQQDELIELRGYLKTLDLKAYQRKVIKKRFLAVYDSDIRIIQQNGKLYLDFSKYDYSDLLSY